MSQFLLAEDGAKAIANHVGSGLCYTDSLVLNRLNECIERLITLGDWKGLIRRMRFYTRSDSITLPREVEKVVKINVDKAPRRVFGMHYEFLENGPGELAIEDRWTDDLEFIGTFPTFFDIPIMTATSTGMKLVAFGSADDAGSDANHCLYAYGRNHLNEEIMEDSVPGAAVPVNRWKDNIEGQIDAGSVHKSALNLYDISLIRKPLTDGYITLFAWDEAAQAAGETFLYSLAKYHPDETSPAYSRYRFLRGVAPQAYDAASAAVWQNLLCLVKLGYVPLTLLTEPMLIQNRAALKFMAQCIQAENDMKDTDAEMYSAKAVRELNRQLENGQHQDSFFQVAESMGIGDGPNFQ